MCQNLRSHASTPYKTDSEFRWKQLSMESNKTKFYPRFRKDEFGAYKKGSWIEAFTLRKWRQYCKLMGVVRARRNLGFHMFVNRTDANDLRHPYAKVEVKNFVASGTWSWDKNQRCETYRNMRIVEVYDYTGKLIWKARK